MGELPINRNQEILHFLPLLEIDHDQILAARDRGLLGGVQVEIDMATRQSSHLLNVVYFLGAAQLLLVAAGFHEVLG